MELEKFEEVYQVLEAQKEKDETAAELYADVKDVYKRQGEYFQQRSSSCEKTAAA